MTQPKRIILITGGASGIGLAIAKKFSGDINNLVLISDIQDDNGREAALAVNGEYFHCNIANEKEVVNLFTGIKTKYQKMDVLVNNAGIIRDNLIWNMPLDDFDIVVNTNLRGTWLMCKEAARMMKEQKNGRIINIVSRAWLGNPGQSNYSSSKAGVVGLTRVLALELGRYNVYVNAVAPGLIDTPLTQNLKKEVLEKLIEAQPTKTIGKPEDVANAVAFLADEKTQFITGQVIYVDGGKSVGAGV